MAKKRPCKDCGKCHSCKDRNRKRAIAAGTHVPYVAKGRKAEIEATRVRWKRLFKNCFLRWRIVTRAMKRGRKAAKRKRRAWEFERNIERYGMMKAKMILACVTRKKNGLWRRTAKSIARFQEWKLDCRIDSKNDTTVE